jgi:hypothetical protein
MLTAAALMQACCGAGSRLCRPPLRQPHHESTDRYSLVNGWLGRTAGRRANCLSLAALLPVNATR